MSNKYLHDLTMFMRLKVLLDTLRVGLYSQSFRLMMQIAEKLCLMCGIRNNVKYVCKFYTFLNIHFTNLNQCCFVYRII